MSRRTECASSTAVTFVRDAQHRITQINDPNGERITYGDDAQGDLTSVTDQGGHGTSFSYDDQHRLLDVINAVGARAVQNEFDASGRLVASIDAYGRRVVFAHVLGARAETTTDRLGNVTVHDYDTAGNVTRKIDALGHQWLEHLYRFGFAFQHKTTYRSHRRVRTTAQGGRRDAHVRTDLLVGAFQP